MPKANVLLPNPNRQVKICLKSLHQFILSVRTQLVSTPRSKNNNGSSVNSFPSHNKSESEEYFVRSSTELEEKPKQGKLFFPTSQTFTNQVETQVSRNADQEREEEEQELLVTRRSTRLASKKAERGDLAPSSSRGSTPEPQLQTPQRPSSKRTLRSKKVLQSGEKTHPMSLRQTPSKK